MYVWIQFTPRRCWLLDSPQVRLTLRDAAVWLVHPIAWVILTVLRGERDPAHCYPYPFLNPANRGYVQVAATVFAVTLGFLALAAIYVWPGNWRRDARGNATEWRPA